MGAGFTAPGRSGPGASSFVRLPGPGGRVAQNWLAISQVAAGIAGHAADIAELRGILANQKPIARLLDNMHPFKLYQLPSVLRETPDPETDWLKVLIRAGRVMETDADGTDDVDSDPDSEAYPSSPTEISIPIYTPKFWFWLEIGSNGGATTAIVRYGTDPAAASYESDWTSTNPWTGAPVPDMEHVPIGWVDTNTNASSRTPIIRQLLRTDINQLGSCGPVVMMVVSYHQDATHGDYLMCQPPGTTLPGDRVEVAVEPQLQSGITTETTPDGSVWAYTYAGGTAQTRIATCTSGPEKDTVLNEYITCPFLEGNMVPVFQCANTGVEVLDPETEEYVSVLRVALTGRHWASA